MNLKNCECCFATYESYKISKDSDGAYWCELSLLNPNGEIVSPKGLCQFCNPKDTKWYTTLPKCTKPHN